MDGREGVGTPTVCTGVEPPSDRTSDPNEVDSDVKPVCKAGDDNLRPSSVLMSCSLTESAVSPFSFPDPGSSAAVLGIKGGALALRRDCTGLGLDPRDSNSDTGVVGGFLGKFGDMLPHAAGLQHRGVSFSGIFRREFCRQCVFFPCHPN